MRDADSDVTGGERVPSNRSVSIMKTFQSYDEQHMYKGLQNYGLNVSQRANTVHLSLLQP